MKLHANIAESEIEIELHDQGPRVLAVIDGREYDVDVQTSRDNHYLLICDAQVFDCRVEGAPESGSTFEVIVGTNRHAFTLTDPRRLRGAPAFGAHGDGAVRILELQRAGRQAMKVEDFLRGQPLPRGTTLL